MQRRDRKQHEIVKLERIELLVYHRFGEAVKQRTKKGALMVKEARGERELGG